ncbi:MAG: tetratricopeptide repeat protein [Candidatus Heimdallarchaeota archaeon]|nr:tetratricopeptide repeat protein [Candidatus Heimdallarchaeota archaeon]
MASEVSEIAIEEGKRALQYRDFSTATQIFSNALIEGKIDEPEYWCNLAEALFYQAQFESALKCWHEAATRDPTNKKIWVRISALYALMGDDDLAIYYYKLAEQLPVPEE